MCNWRRAYSRYPQTLLSERLRQRCRIHHSSESLGRGDLEGVAEGFGHDLRAGRQKSPLEAMLWTPKRKRRVCGVKNCEGYRRRDISTLANERVAQLP